MPILRNQHVLAVPDADESAKFFVERLGFRTEWRIEGQWHAVVRDNAAVMFGSCIDAQHPSTLGDHQCFAYFNVDEVDALFEECFARGLQAEPPKDKPWGLREFHVSTPDGHRMTFGQRISTER